MMFSKVALALTLAVTPMAALACDVTLSSGTDLHAAVATNAGRHVCLGPGTYSLGNSTLHVQSGTKLQGLGTTRDAVVLNSTAGRAISVGNNVTLQNFLLNGPGTGSEFGILTYGNDHVLMWGLRIQNFKISVGVHTSTNVDIWDTFMRYNGVPHNGVADPNLWITQSNNVNILYGELRGRADGPGGDGEAAAYSSTNVRIDGLHVVDSGASALYLVDCDYCSVRNATIHRANEWGIDVVQGSDNFVAENNAVYWSNFGGSVFDEVGSVGGTFNGNTFNSNRRRGVGTCNGINVIGSPAGVRQSGNNSNPPGVICQYQPGR